MMKFWRPRMLLAFAVLIFPSAAQTSTSSSFNRTPISESLSWIHGTSRSAVEYDYEMTARVRLLFFWAGKDDVGGGYIRRGVAADNPREEMLEILFGSDPAKAPRAINRWGAGTEAVWHKGPLGARGSGDSGDDVVASTFFGFMKSSTGKSVSEMQDELKKEKSGGAHQFKGIVSQVESGYARSLVVPLASDQDYTLHQYPDAEQVILGKLRAAEKPTRVLEDTGGCARAGGFLDAVAQLADGAVREGSSTSGGNSVQAKSLCYVYDSQVNTLTLEHVEPMEKFDVKVSAAKGGTLAEKSYDHLLQADFVSAHQATGKRVYFTIVLGTQGELRGAPVQIRYQPNWWFQVVLNLMGQTRAQS